jgi:hypothetical protein
MKYESAQFILILALSTLTLISCVKVLCIEQLNIENCHYGHVSAIHAHTRNTMPPLTT